MSEDAEVRSGPYIGKELSKHSFVVDEPTLVSYYAGLELTRPGEVDALTPSLIASGPDNAPFGEIAFDNHMGHLWMRQEWALYSPLQTGEQYVTGGRITDIYQKRDRNVVRYSVEVHDAAGNLMVATQHHQSFLLERPSGEVTFRDPQAKAGARKFIIPEGQRFQPLERTITLAMCDDFWQGDKNYHSNREESEKLGFKDVVVGGRMTQPYIASLLEDRYGASWWTSGLLDIKFTNPVWLGDTITAHGVETGVSADDPKRTSVFLWISKSDDTVVLIANASVENPD
ncbi:MAG: MaoC/PaaZ C-terminal domain-containing protein [Pseudomonadota bacterium]|nr:MaoC/PaaZ C-terminal domain-containing protein [Pseudomonadota bacterium]